MTGPIVTLRFDGEFERETLLLVALFVLLLALPVRVLGGYIAVPLPRYLRHFLFLLEAAPAPLSFAILKCTRLPASLLALFLAYVTYAFTPTGTAGSLAFSARFLLAKTRTITTDTHLALPALYMFRISSIRLLR